MAQVALVAEWGAKVYNNFAACGAQSIRMPFVFSLIATLFPALQKKTIRPIVRDSVSQNYSCFGTVAYTLMVSE